ncbi:hypothetical protein GCM10022258_34650 [Aquimarina gracilis]
MSLFCLLYVKQTTKASAIFVIGKTRNKDVNNLRIASIFLFGIAQSNSSNTITKIMYNNVLSIYLDNKSSKPLMRWFLKLRIKTFEKKNKSSQLVDSLILKVDNRL